MTARWFCGRLGGVALTAGIALSVYGEGTGAFGFPNLLVNPSFERVVCSDNGGEWGHLESPRTSAEGWVGHGFANVIKNGSPISRTFRPGGGAWMGVVQTHQGHGCSLEQTVRAPQTGTYVFSFIYGRSGGGKIAPFQVRVIEGATTNELGSICATSFDYYRAHFHVPLVGGHTYTFALQSSPRADHATLVDDFSLELPTTLYGRLISGEAGDFDEIIFATRTYCSTPQGRREPHWYANFGYYSSGPQHTTFGSVGRLAAYNFKTGKFRTLLEDAKGSIRDPAVHYDGKTILFSYRPGGSSTYHLYTINADGTGLKALTSGKYDDIEPAWLPDGDIIFCSSRSRRWVNCWVTQVATIFRMKPDGSGIRLLSSNIEEDNTPVPLPDGRILYTRWEYVDRQQMAFHHLWTMNPDGTSHQIYQGNTYPGNSVYIDAKPVPGSDEVILIDSPGHGRTEHGGNVSLLSVKNGPDDPANVKHLIRGRHYDPWALSHDLFMYSADGRSVELTDRTGRRQLLFELPPEWTGPQHNAQLFEPRPLCARPRERILADRTNPALKTGEFYLENVLESRSMAGVKPGTIKQLLILELLPKPINFLGGAHGFGGMEPFSLSGTFSLPRLLGTVPVEEDGSAYFTAPALRSLFFIALDADGRAVKRMQSFTQVMPGEKLGCVGCHERKTSGTVRRAVSVSKALARGPSKIDPSGCLFDVADFPRDVQPVLDRSCVKCHNPDTRSGGLDLCGDRNPMFSMGYYGLIAWNQVLDGRNLVQSDWPPYARGSGGSPLMKKIDGSHHGVKVSERDRRMLMQWLDASAPYAGTYAAGGCGYLGGEKSLNFHNNTAGTPATKAAVAVMARRCDTCHNQAANRLPHSLTDHNGLQFRWRGAGHWTLDLTNPRYRHYHRYLVFDLSRPEKSLFLKAALAKEAGGLGICRTKDGKPVFTSTDDPDYKTLLAMIVEGKELLEKETRFDMPNFCPNPEYLREMIRFGILPENFDPCKTPVNAYDLDRRYWNIDWTTID